MRITTVHWASRLPLSQLFSLGCTKRLDRSYCVTLLVTGMIAMFTVQQSVAQSTVVDDKKREQQELEARVKNTLKKNGESIQFLEHRGQIANPDVLYSFESAGGAGYIELGRIRFVVIKD